MRRRLPSEKLLWKRTTPDRICLRLRRWWGPRHRCLEAERLEDRVRLFVELDSTVKGMLPLWKKELLGRLRARA